ncbi:dihydrolipoyl dehydrogenase [Reticulibacter mediterranei]|uniref:Dihydrolipoyl dehydrogenase n=1 Tax=Reticulibacter mediterranei TaxID=2778369 RepID=A0A8J3N0U1_9CHLR|nr:FAD-dependent oxidoreductase [Reticulibacter mediterranei]GHO94554.1 dihydrolipoyl dehydrogenase [Reticulibacter mediterranei]
MVVGDVTTAVDVLVLGAGPAGYVAAIRAAQLGKHVTLIEPELAGGTCLNRGCIPLKALLSATERYQQTDQEELAAMGICVQSVSFDWAKMQAWKQSVVERLADGVRRLIAGNKIDLVKGTGWFLNAEEVRVEGEYGSHRFKFDHCIIATGASPRPLDGSMTPEQALQSTDLPEHVSIFGDDYIALELATVFARLGAQTTLLLPGEQLLPGVDPVALRLVQVGLRKLRVQTRTNIAVNDLTEQPLIASCGVVPNTVGLHLDACGVEINDDGSVRVDTMMRSSVENIYAVGDCCSASSGDRLASVAIKQGKVAAEVLAGQRVQFAPLVIPRVVHTTPELAIAGYSANEANQAGYAVKVGRFPLAANGRALTLNTDNGVVLLVANAEDEALLGATLVGPRAGDLIAQVALAIEMGATLTDFSEILFAHPGLSETLQESADSALQQAIHMLAK